jgi:CRISPR-associated protein Cmr4
VEGLTTELLTPDSALQKLVAPEYGLVPSFGDFALPIITRNQLDEKGTSRNLWYEEVVPYKSVFAFVVLVPDDTQYAHHFQAFNQILQAEGNAVQFGGNASVGYGYTTVTKVG